VNVVILPRFEGRGDLPRGTRHRNRIRARGTLFGSRSLEGLNFRIEPVTKRLVDAGPAPAAVLRG